MSEPLLAFLAVTISLTGVLAFRIFMKALKPGFGKDYLQQFESAFRTEGERIRQTTDDQARGMRAELAQNIQRCQDSTLNAFTTLGDALRTQAKEAGDRLDAGVAAVDRR